ncbi:methyltransferase domain-containing protein [Azospirillum soli]|uniref:methyltransferase domain-containing protein n=1 Tax=Azospirillum soli TaxID=1304799 RepID=UPI001AE949D4|nr:methyltransferase domain-containing protein [Azospirillum soli]MBP2315155.1 trans-aconitate 2-methyltransferase [Azospirillum soli]
MPWDPEQYELFDVWRRRPAHDLAAALPSLDPKTVVDLGCGGGHLARLLAERWPNADVLGVDNSPAMLKWAEGTASRVRWQRADLRTWRPHWPVDLLISNAALHWLDDHERLFPELLETLAPGGVLAVQMPRNFDAPSHTLLYETAAEGPWAAKLDKALRHKPVHAPQDYYDWLSPLAKRVDIWETEYLQVLNGDVPVLQWTRGTTLVPVLETLAGEELDAFLAAYRGKLEAAYPQHPDGNTLFPFKRLFIVARV